MSSACPRTDDAAAPPVVAVLAVLDQLPGSADPLAAFEQALRSCVPALARAGAVDLVIGADRHRLLWPDGTAVIGPPADEHAIVDDTVFTPIRSVGGDAGSDFGGMLALRYELTRPGPNEALIGQLVVERVVSSVHRERLRADTEQERARADHLERALENSRDIGTAIGILMSSQKCRTEQAFEQLRQVSQTTHRKIREIARDVIETGTL